MTSTSKSKSPEGYKVKAKSSFYESWTFLLLLCVVLPLLFRSLVFAPFHIPSGSMKPGLLIGDFIFVSKASYGYSNYSFPLSPNIVDGRIWMDAPKRGDVAVFRPAPQPYTDFIKRVIGLPGDSIQLRGGELFINGKKTERTRIEDYVEIADDGTEIRLKQYIETLPNGTSYRILDDTPNGHLDNTPVITVPAGHYFMMGDNRDHSADSRTNKVGFVPLENMVGRAEVIAISTTSKLWKIWQWPSTLRTERIMLSIPSGNNEPKEKL